MQAEDVIVRVPDTARDSLLQTFQWGLDLSLLYYYWLFS